MAESGMDFRVDTSEWNKLYADLKEFDPKLRVALRREIKAIGEIGAEAVRKALSQPTPEGNPDGPVRDALKAATKVRVSFSAKSAGVKIVTSGGGLPAGSSPMLHAYNSMAWRHPVFGDRSNWVTEQGHPFFEKPIEEVVGPAMYTRIGDALDEAIRALEGR